MIEVLNILTKEMKQSRENMAFLCELAVKDPDIGILAVEMLPISMHFTVPPLAREAVCAAITRILDAHGLYRVVVAGHSYGRCCAPPT